jgi:hypothetical protein
MAELIVRGSYAKTESWLNKLAKGDLASTLDSLGRRGVAALASATPADSGLTARSWNYRVKRNSRSVTIEWYNTNVVNGFPVAIGLQYGHGTGTGGYIVGRDYINPAIKPVFDDIEKAIERAVR